MSDRPSAGSPGPSGAWRVGDLDRDAAVEALSEHYAVGRLEKDEYDERTDRAYAARTEADLGGLFTDLPLPHGAAVPTVAPGASDPRSGHGPRRRSGRPVAGRHHHRGPFGPWLLLAIPIVILTGAYWLIWLVPVLLWCVVRPARRRYHGRGVARG